MKNFYNIYLNIIGGQGLRSAAIMGSLAIGAGNVGEKAFRFLRNVILTRILVPEAFGIMAIVMAVNMALESLTQIGTNLSIIHNERGRENAFLNGAWIMSMGRALMLFIIAFAAAPWIADLYEKPELTTLMRVGFVGILLNGAMSPKAHVALKDMEYKKWVIINHGANAIGIAATIVLAVVLKNVWALIIGFIVEATLRMALSYVVCPFCPSFRTDEQSRRGLFRYARGMIGLPIMTFIFNKTDVFVIGKLCQLMELGLYTMAITIAMIPAEIFASVIGQVFMPVFSNMKSNEEKVSNIIMTMTSILAAILMPIVVFALLYGKELLELLYGTEYGMMAYPFSIVMMSVMVQTIGIPIVTLFFAQGHPEYNRRFAALRAIAILIIMYPAVKEYGTIGAALAVLFSMIIGYCAQLWQYSTVAKFEIKKYLWALSGPFIASSPIMFMWYLSRAYEDNKIIYLGTGVLGILAAYALAFISEMKNNYLHIFDVNPPKI